MKTYIYPENLRVTMKLWTVIPLAVTVCYAFLSLRADDISVMDYIVNAVKFFVTSQQLFLWEKGYEK